VWVWCNESTAALTFACYLVDRVVVAHLILIKYMGMPMWECSSFYILSWDSNMIPVLNESCKCQCLGSSPIDSYSFLDWSVSLFKNFPDESMEVLVFRKTWNSVSNWL
jgi:hypothetical protein